MGVSTQSVRDWIHHGYFTGTETVKLQAEMLTVNGRRMHRIYLDSFITFLTAIGWQRVPKHPRAA